MPRKKSQAKQNKEIQNSEQLERSIVERCPYCESKDFVKRGLRKNKHQEVQLFACRNPECARTFTARTIKGKQFPWPVVLDAISYYNLGYSFEQCSKILEAKFYCPAAEVESSSRSNAEVDTVTGLSGQNGHAAKGDDNVGSGTEQRQHPPSPPTLHKATEDKKATEGHVRQRDQGLSPKEQARKAQAISAAPRPDTIASWYDEYKSLCRFERLRPYALKILNAWRSGIDPKDNVDFYMVETTTLAHRQLYRFRYHRPKMVLLLEEYKNRNFGRLMEYLDVVSTDTPHQFFKDGARMSEVKSKFDKTQMIVRGKENFANKFTKFVLQAVPNNKDRHEILQRFMIANDSVTVATEVPVYIRKEDVTHFEKKLGFKVSEHYCPSADIAETEIDTVTGLSGQKGHAAKGDDNVRQRDKTTSAAGQAGEAPDVTNGYIKLKGKKRPQPFPDLMTGHIDIVQVRNGVVHILDYKPNADKEKPIEQLTWYALALSRLTGLRLFEFKCAWFDEYNYYEFYPLHVVKKQNRKRRKKVRYKDGKVASVPNEDELHIIK